MNADFVIRVNYTNNHFFQTLILTCTKDEELLVDRYFYYFKNHKSDTAGATINVFKHYNIESKNSDSCRLYRDLYNSLINDKYEIDKKSTKRFYAHYSIEIISNNYYKEFLVYDIDRLHIRLKKLIIADSVPQ